MNYNLILNVPEDTHLGHYDTVETPDGDKYHIRESYVPTTDYTDPDDLPMGGVIEEGVTTRTKEQSMKSKQVYTDDPNALPKAVHKQLMNGRINWAHSGDGSDLKMPGTLVVNGRKLLHFVTEYTAQKVQTFIDNNDLDWVIECHQPFTYTYTEDEDGKRTYSEAPSKGIKASRVVPFVPERYAEYDDDGNGVGSPLKHQKEWLHHFGGMSEWLLQSEV